MADHRIGLIVPSSNTTMETELPELFRRRQEADPQERFTFHSSRARMQHVTPDELARMVEASDESAAALADARVDAIAYACLVAVMAQGRGAHAGIEQRLAEAAAAAAGAPLPVISSAGALVTALHALGARRVAVVTPYMKPLTGVVCDYIDDAGVEVLRSVSLEVSDNLAVGRLDPAGLVPIAEGLDTSDADALVLSACVQMPSLPAIQPVEDRLGIPVISAATATAFALHRALGLAPRVRGAGVLLSGQAPAGRVSES